MLRHIAHGAAAGAIGTVALNTVTYADMAIRGRPASSVPEQDVQILADRFGIDLGQGEQAAARREALGALLGYLTGMAIGVVYGVVRPLARGVPPPVAAVAVGLGAMAATDTASVRLGTTDPTTWSAGDWASDVVPHLAYGAATVAGYDALAG
jgi:hypothetical protein